MAILACVLSCACGLVASCESGASEQSPTEPPSVTTAPETAPAEAPAPDAALRGDRLVASDARVATDQYLSRVPADTAVLAAAIGGPETTALDTDWSAFYDTFANAMEADLAGSDHTLDLLMWSTLQELRGKYTIDGLAGLGVAPAPDFVVYTVGAAPVLRVELTDGRLASQAFDRIDVRAGIDAERREHAGVPLRAWPLDKWSLVAAVMPNELVLVLSPDAQLDANLDLVLGPDGPETSVAAAGGLPTDGRAPSLAGWIDLARVDEELSRLDASAGITAMRFFGVPSSMAEACLGDLERVATLLPRVEFWSHTDASIEAGRVRFLLGDPAVVEALDAMRVPIAGLGERAWTPLLEPSARERPYAFLGLGLDLAALGSWLESLATTVEEQPFACTQLLRTNRHVASVAELYRSQLAAVRDALGLYAVATHLEVGRRGVESLEGVLVLGTDSPNGLWEKMTAGTELTGIRLSANRGRALPALPGYPMLNSIAAREAPGALMFTSGATVEDPATSLIEASARDLGSLPLAEFGYDYGWLAQAYFDPNTDAETFAATRTAAAVGDFGLFTISVDADPDAGAVVASYELERSIARGPEPGPGAPAP